jgi:predicted dehydrogenase
MIENHTFGWGIIGPGAIAHQFADAVHRSRIDGMNGGLRTRTVAVLGRDSTKAKAFAQHWNRDDVPEIIVADNIDALLARDDIHGIYIATPNTAHFDFACAALRAGKAVLCEKPLVPNAKLAHALVALAKQHNTFLMEALWTRFLPIYSDIRGWLHDTREGHHLGRVRSVQSSFCFNSPFNAEARHFSPALAGGALLDIGIYCLAMSRWVLQAAYGTVPALQHLHARGVLAPTGVDTRVSVALEFAEDVSVQFICGFDGSASNSLEIYCEHGTIKIPRNFWAASEATIQITGHKPYTHTSPHRYNGFEYEMEEVMRCVKVGKIESSIMSHQESIELATCLEDIRRQIGVKYPFELGAGDRLY